MELIVTAVGILLLLLAWRAWKKTVLDDTRDRLFDLRDGAREWFLVKGYGLNHPMYRQLRDLLNAQLRFTEHIRFIGLVFFSWRVPAKTVEVWHRQFDGKFGTADRELQLYIQQTRRLAIRSMQRYMIKTSTVFAALLLVAIPILAMFVAWQGVAHLYSNTRMALIDLIDRTSIRPVSIELSAEMSNLSNRRLA